MKHEKIQYLKLKSVTPIYRTKASGAVAHVGLILKYLGEKELILHKTPEKGVHLSSFAQFSNGRRVFHKESYQDKNGVMQKRISMALSRKEPYQIFKNCEHLVSKIITGIPTSKQLQAALTYGLIGGVAVGITSENKKTAVLAGLLFGFIALQYEKDRLLST